MTKFLTVSNRTVILSDSDEKADSKSKKQHMMTSHGGDIYLHRITEPQKIAEPPNILDGPGGRRSDYREKEFFQLLKNFLLYPTSNKDNTLGLQKDIDLATRIWPMVKSESALYTMCSAGTANGSILQYLIKPVITDEEKNKVC